MDFLVLHIVQNHCMNTSILLYCHNQAIYLEPFFKSLLKQTSVIHELICILPANNENSLELVTKIKEIAPFSTFILQPQAENEFDTFLEGMRSATGDILLFSTPNYLFHPRKVSLYKEMAGRNPYQMLFFANSSLSTDNEQQSVHDLFGLTGFHERWDVYNKITSILIKQIGFLSESHIGISKKGVDRVLNFFDDYAYLPKIHLNEFLVIFFAMFDEKTICEIPYVLSKQLVTYTQYTSLMANKQQLNYTTTEHLKWLQNYLEVATLINQNHDVIQKLKKAIQFQQNRLKPANKNKFLQLFQFILGKYHKYSFEPFSELRKDIR